MAGILYAVYVGKKMKLLNMLYFSATMQRQSGLEADWDIMLADGALIVYKTSGSQCKV